MEYQDFLKARKQVHDISLIVDNALRSDGLLLTLSTFDVLSRVANTPSAKQAEVASAIGITSATMVSLLDHLCRSGYAERTPSEVDRRVKHVSITPKGMLALEHAKDVVACVFDSI